MDMSLSAAIRVISIQDKWRALPFLVLMFSAGLPLTYKLEAARPMDAAANAEVTMAAIGIQSTGNSTFFVVLISCLYLMAGWALVKKPKIVVTLLFRQWPAFLLIILIAASTFWSHAPEKVMMNVVHNIGTTLIAIAAALFYRSNPWLFPKHLGYVVGVNMVLHLAAVALIPAYAIDWQGRWHGLASHPNTLGALAFVVLWSNATVLIFKKNDPYHLHLIFSVLGIIAMLGSNSVTSMICSALALLIIYAFYILKKVTRQQRIYLSILGLCLFVPITTMWLSKDIDVDVILKFFGRDSSLTGRLSLWEDAFKVISGHEFLGWSFDDHMYLVRTGNMDFPHFHNGFLDLAVNGGLVAILLFFFLLITMTADYFKPSRVGSEITPFSVAFVLALMVFSISEAALVSPRGQLWEIFLALVFLGTCKDLSKSDAVFLRASDERNRQRILQLQTIFETNRA